MNRNFKSIATGTSGILTSFTSDEWDVTPDVIKAFHIEILSPYIFDQDFLKKEAVNLLAPLVPSVVNICNDAWTKWVFEDTLQAYRDGSKVDKPLSVSTYADWMPKVSLATSEFWSFHYFASELDGLELEEFRFEAFRVIGLLIEACLQPQLKNLLCQVRIRRGKGVTVAQVTNMKLGNVVEELDTTANLGDACRPAPWHIRLNQWRNIAQHHKSHIDLGKIVGLYGTPPNEAEIRLERAQLAEVVLKIKRLYLAMHTAYEIFGMENLEDIRPLVAGKLRIRDEVRLMQLVTSLSTQGFELKDFEQTAEANIATVQDVTDQDEVGRMAHASQFPYVL